MASINKWGDTHSMPRVVWWLINTIIIILFIMSVYFVLLSQLSYAVGLCQVLAPWTASNSVTPAPVASLHSCLHIVSLGPDLHVALSRWSSHVLMASSSLLAYSFPITNFQCKPNSVMFILWLFLLLAANFSNIYVK